MQQQARANLVKLHGVKAQIMSSLVAATDQPSREFFQTQLNTADNEIVQCNLVLQQAAKDEAMDIASANLGELYASKSDEDFEDRACFDDLVKLDDVTLVGSRSLDTPGSGVYSCLMLCDEYNCNGPSRKASRLAVGARVRNCWSH